jgi:alpha,alpha-trehalase
MESVSGVALEVAHRCPSQGSPPHAARSGEARRPWLSRIAAAAALISINASTAACHADVLAGPPLPPPEVLYGELFADVQTAQIFDDQKTFVDALPNLDPALIVQMYQQQKGDPSFELETFVNAHFTLPIDQSITPPANQSLREHIDWLWPELTRNTMSAPAGSSLIPLPSPYVVPGGRFREVYYWDSYFTMLGLEEAGRSDLVDSMLQNFAYEIDQLGHIPNGNRTYYVSRSQPPFFSNMVEIAARRAGARVYAQYLQQLRREYSFWMSGAEDTAPGRAFRRVVVLPDGTVLNRYWDDLDTPRDEAYIHDVQTAARASGRPLNQVYRDLRATAESGWDFSSRWLADNQTLATIRTTSIIPIDLNSLLFHLEATIVKGCAIEQELACVKEFVARAARRAKGIEQYLWNDSGYYSDYDWELQRPRDNVTAAMFYPLFVGVALPERARKTAEVGGALLLQPGGLATTMYDTGEQWDAPNGWAPLQWVAVAGLRRYGKTDLARAIGERFLGVVSALYASEGKLVEKYAVSGEDVGSGGGGEYPTQDGFGWTNAVTLLLLDLYPPAPPATPAASGE